MGQVGTGIVIAFDSGFFAEILGVDHDGIERPSIDNTHMLTTTAKEFMPGDLYDPGELAVELAFIPGTPPPWTDAAETVTVTFPDTTTWICQGFLTGFKYTGPLEERMTANATIKFSGAITF